MDFPKLCKTILVTVCISVSGYAANAEGIISGFINLEELKLTDKNYTRFTVSVNDTKGNTKSISHNVSLEYLKHNNSHMKKAMLQYSNLDMEFLPRHQEKLSLKLGYDFGKVQNIHLLAIGTYDQDNYSAHKSRTSFGLGFGHQIAAKKFTISSIAALNNHSLVFSDKVQLSFNQDPSQMTVSFDFDIKYRIRPKLQLELDLSYYRGLEHKDTWLFDASTRFTYALAQNVSANLIYDLDYRSHDLSGLEGHEDRKIMFALSFNL